jgi:hypothetical protein
MAVRVTTVTLSVDNKEHEERLPDLPGSCGAWCLLEPAQVLIVPQTPLHFSPLMLDPSQISALNVGLGIFNACFMKFLFRQEPIKYLLGALNNVLAINVACLGPPQNYPTL